MLTSYFYEFLLIQLGAGIFMTGVIWQVQLLTYPSFQAVDQIRFTAFHQYHKRTISFIVVPPMIIELVTACLLVYITPAVAKPIIYLNFALVVLLWFSTFFIQVPLHSKLTRSKKPEVIKRLTDTNWIRTFLWSAKSILLIYLIWLLHPQN